MGKTYSEKLRDPQWQRMRLKVMERDAWACQNCGDKRSTLHVHHTYYVSGREPWAYPTGALVVICESCHEAQPDFNAIGVDALSDALEAHRHKPPGASISRIMCAKLMANALCAWLDMEHDDLRPSDCYLDRCSEAIDVLRSLEPRELPGVDGGPRDE